MQSSAVLRGSVGGLGRPEQLPNALGVSPVQRKGVGIALARSDRVPHLEPGLGVWTPGCLGWRPPPGLTTRFATNLRLH